MEVTGTVKTKAIYSDANRNYRYYLEKSAVEKAKQGEKIATIIMLNPSYADEYKLDLSIMKVFNMLLKEGYTTLKVVNLFAFVATKHSALVSTVASTGGENDKWIKKAITNIDLLIIAWGSNEDQYKRRKYQVNKIINSMNIKEKPKQIKCFIDKQKRKGRHPSRLGELELINYP
ncbi:DUF1643 domain-containing protein [Paenibacillus sp. 11B]|uniref:DUF1643 domain-containing protein n=1 Tax=Paenibacillus sp. 11B TaxID=3060965 RepID=UPI002650A498|nr:DUF1643 domain-containing protein [Paenibacillus sp. 11B]MDN8592718.1 DUF1643 domain-containing protein [Paenibacillus sp. 11B]